MIESVQPPDPGAPSSSQHRALVSAQAADYLHSLATGRAVEAAGTPGKRLSEVLMEILKITAEQLQEVLIEQLESKELIGDILLRKGWVRAEYLREVLRMQEGVFCLDLRNIDIPRHVLQKIPEHIIRQHKLLPIDFTPRKLTIGMIHPENLAALEILRFRFKNVFIEPVRISEDDYYHFLAMRMLEPSLQVSDELVSGGDDEILTELEGLQNTDSPPSEAPIIQIASSILARALNMKASDVHLDPLEQALVVRYRIDGVLHKDQMLPVGILLPLVSRFKIMANMDITEKRLPQDGRIRIRVRSKDIDFRVSTIPTKHGEKVCMRLLDRSSQLLQLDRLFILPEVMEMVRNMISRPNGIIFVTGPTGSGKTTTLYAILTELNTDEINIVTAEDPIEYELKGIAQVQVKTEIDLSFAAILRSFLRQDPDIMLIGETRDRELARVVIEAALTGHLVFTSLHTNDAPGAITRLQEMGVDGFLIAAATVGVISQRVVRTLCTDCRASYRPSAKELDLVGFPHRPGEVVEWYRPVGCDQCMGGYKGRIGVFEVMILNDELRELIAQGATKAVIRYTAKLAGMITLKEYAMRCIALGYTSYEELLRVIYTNEGQEKLCPTCRNVVGEEFLKCPFCQCELRQVCGNCQRPVSDGWLSCPACGQMLKAAQAEDGSHCHHCGTALEANWRYCPACSAPSGHKRHCPSCQMELQSGWLGCPACMITVT